MAMAVGRSGFTSVKSEPNVVPMIDIMLVLLIIFMIVTPLIANGFKAMMPSGLHLDKRPEGDNEVVLGVDASGAYFLNGNPVPAETLEDHLKSIYATSHTEDKIMYFRGDKDLPFEKIQDAVEIARKAGVPQKVAREYAAADRKRGKTRDRR